MKPSPPAGSTNGRPVSPLPVPALRVFNAPRAAYAQAGFVMLKKLHGSLKEARTGRDTVFGVTIRPGHEVRGEDDEPRMWSAVRDWDRDMAIDLGFQRNHIGRMVRHRPALVLTAQWGAATWHYHGIASVPIEHAPTFEARAGDLWRRHSPGGDLLLEPIHDEGGWLAYTVRKLHPCDPFQLRTLPVDFLKHFPLPASLRH